MKRAFLIILCLFFLVACRPPDSGSSANSETEPSTTSPTPAPSEGLRVRVETEGNPALGPVPVLVYILNDDEGVSGATVEVTGDMTHAGMVPVITEASESEPGLYRADRFEFTMAGDWILTAEVELPDGTKEMAETSLTVPGQ